MISEHCIKNKYFFVLLVDSITLYEYNKLICIPVYCVRKVASHGHNSFPQRLHVSVYFTPKLMGVDNS